jgi:hypothetical protein
MDPVFLLRPVQEAADTVMGLCGEKCRRPRLTTNEHLDTGQAG